MSKHYLATVAIKRVERVDAKVGSYGNNEPGPRVIADLASLVIKADSIESLVAKVQAHLALVDDVADADDTSTPQQPPKVHR